MGWRAGALILERIAGTGGIDPDLDTEAQDESWRNAIALAQTLTDAELLDDELTGEALLYRLFGLEGVVGAAASRAGLWLPLLAPETFQHPRGLPRATISTTWPIEGDIIMTCEFCNLDFRFDRGEVRGQTRPGGRQQRGRRGLRMRIARRMACCSCLCSRRAAATANAPARNGFAPLTYSYLVPAAA